MHPCVAMILRAEGRRSEVKITGLDNGCASRWFHAAIPVSSLILAILIPGQGRCHADWWNN